MIYVADELIFQIMTLGYGKNKFVREAIEEKLDKENK